MDSNPRMEIADGGPTRAWALQIVLNRRTNRKAAADLFKEKNEIHTIREAPLQLQSGFSDGS